MKLSIVVPIYNVEKYLSGCVNSILEQYLKDIEIILVDDGSTDNSGKICDQFAKEDNRVTVLHKENGGLMSAWKYGVKHSHGDYIGFVDSDDWIDPEMYETLLKTIMQDQSDMVICGLVKEYEDGHKEIDYNYVKTGLYEKNEIIEKIYPVLLKGSHYLNRGISINRVTKLFKKTLLDSVLDGLPDEISIGEDLLTTFRALTNSEKVTVLSDYTPYHYRINSQSMIKQYSEIKYEKINLLYQEICNTTCEDYDFTKQINTDYIKLLLIQLDDEILFSKKSFLELRKSLKDRFGNKNFKKIVKDSEAQQLGKKYRLYLMFFKTHLWGFAIFMRKIKSRLKNE